MRERLRRKIGFKVLLESKTKPAKKLNLAAKGKFDLNLNLTIKFWYIKFQPEKQARKEKEAKRSQADLAALRRLLKED